MDKDLVVEMEKFSLTDEEKLGIALEEEDIVTSSDECLRSLFGAIHGVKKANFAGLKSTMTHIWPIQDTFILREIGLNRFQFVFKTKEDKCKVLKNRTWIFDNQFLILKEWVECNGQQELDFSLVDVWIQIWDLPHNWISTETGMRIGKMFHSMSDIYIPESGSIKGRHIKLLVAINLKKPLLRGASIKLGGVAKWVNFKYEKMVGFCFYCGFVGHLDRMCEKKMKDVKNNSFCDGQYGDWLRAADLQLPVKNKVGANKTHYDPSEKKDEVQTETSLFPQTKIITTEVNNLEKGKAISDFQHHCEGSNGKGDLVLSCIPIMAGKLKDLDEIPESSYKPPVQEEDIRIKSPERPPVEETVSMDLSNLVEIEVRNKFSRNPLKEIQNTAFQFVGTGCHSTSMQRVKKNGKSSSLKNGKVTKNKDVQPDVEVGLKRRRNISDENQNPNFNECLSNALLGSKLSLDLPESSVNFSHNLKMWKASNRKKEFARKATTLYLSTMVALEDRSSWIFEGLWSTPQEVVGGAISEWVEYTKAFKRSLDFSPLDDDFCAFLW
ncbi:hypothetical protein DH2020_022326 [Rehmannia glutinosa]|uniref:CCHC-type domain-containing protein n=1 Tax=Rehmannia glutinosa TaxID=99300 RepID=A0ABR0WD13_REHGL